MKIHWTGIVEPDPWISACGVDVGNHLERHLHITETESKVTCGRCLKVIAAFDVRKRLLETDPWTAHLKPVVSPGTIEYI